MGIDKIQVAIWYCRKTTDKFRDGTTSVVWWLWSMDNPMQASLRSNWDYPVQVVTTFNRYVRRFVWSPPKIQKISHLYTVVIQVQFHKSNVIQQQEESITSETCDYFFFGKNLITIYKRKRAKSFFYISVDEFNWNEISFKI